MRFSVHRQLQLAGILATLALAGCGGGPSNHGGGPGNQGAYAVFRWKLSNVMGYPVGCGDVAAAAVVVTMTNASTGGVYTQAAVNCTDMQMTTDTLPAGDYYVGFDLYGDPTTYGNTSTVLDSFDVVDTTGYQAVFHLAPGGSDFRDNWAQFVVRSLDVGWTFVSGTPAAVCAALGARWVDLYFSTSASPTTSVGKRFNCTDAAGASLPFPYGPTSAQWSLYLMTAANTEITHIDGGAVALPPLTSQPNDVSLGLWTFNL